MSWIAFPSTAVVPAIFCGLLALLFAISWCRRDAHGVASDAVIDLPYASTTGMRVASTGATRGDDIMGKVRGIACCMLRACRWIGVQAYRRSGAQGDRP